jgi:hypothetical protein
VIEVTAEHYVYGSRRVRAMIEELARSVPVVAHGVTLSVGTAQAPDPAFLREVRAFLEAVRAPWYSEHLAFTKTPRHDLSQLLPLPRSAEVLGIVCENLATVKRALGVPLLLENVSYYFEYRDSPMSEKEFLLGVLLGSGSSLLLDVENVRINAANHRYDPVGFVAGLPPGIVRAVHVAGGQARDGLQLDSHDRPASPDTLALLSEALRTQRPETIVVERDRDFGDMREVLEDVRRIRAAVAGRRPPSDRRGEVLGVQELVLRVMSEPGTPPPEAGRVLGDAAAERLALVGRLAEAKRRAKIQASLPRTCAALGAEFPRLARDFAEGYPARSSRNRVNALAFYRFLRRRARTHAAPPPHLLDLARCELALISRASPPGAARPDWRGSGGAIAIRRAPGVRVHAYAWDIRPLLVGTPNAPVEPRPIRVAILADPVRDEPRVLGVTDEAYELLRALRGWTRLDAGEGASARPRLREMAALGLIEIAEKPRRAARDPARREAPAPSTRRPPAPR